MEWIDPLDINYNPQLSKSAVQPLPATQPSCHAPQAN